MPSRNNFVTLDDIRNAPSSKCNRGRCRCQTPSNNIIHCIFTERHSNGDKTPSLLAKSVAGSDDKGNLQDKLMLKCVVHPETTLVEFLDSFANSYGTGVTPTSGSNKQIVEVAPPPIIEDQPPPEEITYPEKGDRMEWWLPNIYGNKGFTRYRQNYDAPKESKKNKRVWFGEDYKSSGMSPNDTLAGLEYLLAKYDFDGSPKFTVEGKNPYGGDIVIEEGELLSDKVRAQAEKEGLNIYSLGTMGTSVTLSDDVIKFLLKIREKIVLAPDNDEGGIQHMRRSAVRLLELADELGINADIRILHPYLYASGEDTHEDLEQAFEQGYSLGKLIGLSETFDPTETFPDVTPIQESEPPRKGLDFSFHVASERVPEVDLSEPEYILYPWIPKGAIVMLSGFHKYAGKTTLLLSWSHAICYGLPWGNSPVPEPKAVVMLTEESERTFVLALRRAGLHNCPNFFYICWDQLLLATDEEDATWEKLVEYVAKYAADRDALLAFDTLSPFVGLRGEGENLSGEARHAMKQLIKARGQYGLTIYCNRHENKSGGGAGYAALGSGQWEAMGDVMMQLKPESKGEPNDPDAPPVDKNIRVITGYSRPDPAFPAETRIRANAGTHSDDWSSKAWEILPSKEDPDDTRVAMARSEILNLLPTEESKAMTVQEIKDHRRMAGIGLNAIRDALAILWEEQGMIQRTGAGNGASPYKYWRPSEFNPID